MITRGVRYLLTTRDILVLATRLRYWARLSRRSMVETGLGYMVDYKYVEK